MRRVKAILNIAAYRFVTLNDAADLRESIRSQAHALELKGTVLPKALGRSANSASI